MPDHQRVVLCESDAVLAGVLSDVLASEGFAVTLCTALAEIEAEIGQDPAAVVVTDSWLGGPPGLLGIDTAGLQQLAARTPVVLTTAWTSESQLAALAALGLGAALHVVPKPYDLDDLLAAVQGAVAAHRRTLDDP